MFYLPGSFSRVTEDAITVTKELNYQYLWVDKYRIDQQNERDKHTQIVSMDSIYRNAVLTIIAAAGERADDGLPGIGTTRRNVQPSASAQGLRLVSSMSPPAHFISRSKWATRGWTYQEGVLSTRQLVFTREQIYFECKGTHCCESIEKPFGLLSSRDKRDEKGLKPSLRRGYFGTIKGGAIFVDRPSKCDASDFTRHVKQYTPRHLSYDSDALDAFAGIIKEYHRRLQFCFLGFLGLPIGSGPNPVCPENTLVQNLLWRHDQDDIVRPRRRPGFPSYC